MKYRTLFSRENNNINLVSAAFAQAELNAITIKCLYNFDPFKPHFYIVKLRFTGVYIISLISAQNHRLWVHVRTASLRQF